MANDGISEKVLFLLELAKKGTASESELSKIIEMMSAQSDNVTLGRVFGYSVSDYAIATLKWLDSENALLEYEKAIRGLSDNRMSAITELITNKPYLQI